MKKQYGWAKIKGDITIGMSNKYIIVFSTDTIPTALIYCEISKVKKHKRDKMFPVFEDEYTPISKDDIHEINTENMK